MHYIYNYNPVGTGLLWLLLFLFYFTIIQPADDITIYKPRTYVTILKVTCFIIYVVTNQLATAAQNNVFEYVESKHWPNDCHAYSELRDISFNVANVRRFITKFE